MPGGAVGSPRRSGGSADATLRALEALPGFEAAVARARFTLVRVPGLDTEVLLPATAGDPFSEWAHRLAKTCSFPRQDGAIRELCARSSSPSLDPSSGELPLVGVFISEPKHLLSGGSASAKALIEHVRRLGCRPVLIPPRADLLLPPDRLGRWAGITAMVRRLDGVVGPGGNDVHPRIYKEPNRYARSTNYPRDRFEADAALAALRSDLFMLGVCRSHQLWNAASGGKLIQDVEQEGYASRSLNQDNHGLAEDEPFVLRDARGQVVHENRVYVANPSGLAALLGSSGSFVTNAFHHQAVKQPGEGFAVAGVVRDPVTHREAIEATEAWNAITVQWHPELAKSTSTADRAVIDTFGRRAHVFHLVRALRSQGVDPTAAALRERMRARPELGFTSADLEWIERALVDHLASKAG